MLLIINCQAFIQNSSLRFMYPTIQSFCDALSGQFSEISAERKALLTKITAYIQAKMNAGEAIQLAYICTHNSRRSHFGQVWAAVAAEYYGIAQVSTFSGGTMATAFNPNAINSLVRTGFEVSNTGATENPIYTVRFSETGSTTCFSKVYDDEANPKAGFAAIMTCSDAEENCPFIPGVELRIGTTYEDPKAYDNTPLQDAKYDERSRQIALETLFVFSQLSK
jgi:protein-tyrosine phosphatase/arsenate reductase